LISFVKEKYKVLSSSTGFKPRADFSVLAMKPVSSAVLDKKLMADHFKAVNNISSPMLVNFDGVTEPRKLPLVCTETFAMGKLKCDFVKTSI